ncbi:ZN831 protein, partial [Polypterus senegalus]
MDTAKQKHLTALGSKDPRVQESLPEHSSNLIDPSEQLGLSTVYVNALGVPLYHQQPPICRKMPSVQLSFPHMATSVGQGSFPPQLPTLALSIVNGLPVLLNQKLVNMPPARAKNSGKHVCVHCGRDCLKPSVLEKHLRCHTGERPYPCATCGIAFKTQSNLYKHKRTQAHARMSCDANSTGCREESLRTSESTSEIHSTEELNVMISGKKEVAPHKAEMGLTKELTERCRDRLNTGRALRHAALVGLILAPGTGEEDDPSSDHQKGVLTNEVSDLQFPTIGPPPGKGRMNQLTHLPSRHTPLQRQEATYFSKQWNSRSTSGKSLSHDSIDSGYLSHSESGEQQPWVCSPNSSLQEQSVESITDISLAEQPEGAAFAVMKSCSEKETSEAMKTAAPYEKNQLEARILKLISDNDALVEDKCLENVRPRKTLLSKQGSIDLPMPYTYKDSFHFDMKASKKTSVRWSYSPGMSKLGLFNSSQSSTPQDHFTLTRSSSLPFVGTNSDWNQMPSDSSNYQDGVLRRRINSGLSHTGGAIRQSGDLQSSHPRSLVRQGAVDCCQAVESLHKSFAPEDGSQGSLGSDGPEPCDVSCESSCGKSRRKKTQKFSYNKWYMYGDGIFRKLYQTKKEDNHNVKVADGGDKIMKCSGKSSFDATVSKSFMLHRHDKLGSTSDKPASETPGHLLNGPSQVVTLSPQINRLESKNVSVSHNVTDFKVSFTSPAKTLVTHKEIRSLDPALAAMGQNFSSSLTHKCHSNKYFQKSEENCLEIPHIQDEEQCSSFLSSAITNIRHAWSSDTCLPEDLAQNDKAASLSHLPSERKKQKTDFTGVTSSNLAEWDIRADRIPEESAWAHLKETTITSSLNTQSEGRTELTTIKATVGQYAENPTRRNSLSLGVTDQSVLKKPQEPMLPYASAQEILTSSCHKVKFHNETKMNFLPVYQLELPPITKQVRNSDSLSSAFPEGISSLYSSAALLSNPSVVSSVQDERSENQDSTNDISLSEKIESQTQDIPCVQELLRHSQVIPQCETTQPVKTIEEHSTPNTSFESFTEDLSSVRNDMSNKCLQPNDPIQTICKLTLKQKESSAWGQSNSAELISVQQSCSQHTASQHQGLPAQKGDEQHISMFNPNTCLPEQWHTQPSSSAPENSHAGHKQKTSICNQTVPLYTGYTDFHIFRGSNLLQQNCKQTSQANLCRKMSGQMSSLKLSARSQHTCMEEADSQSSPSVNKTALQVQMFTSATGVSQQTLKESEKMSCQKQTSLGMESQSPLHEFSEKSHNHLPSRGETEKCCYRQQSPYKIQGCADPMKYSLTRQTSNKNSEVPSNFSFVHTNCNAGESNLPKNKQILICPNNTHQVQEYSPHKGCKQTISCQSLPSCISSCPFLLQKIIDAPNQYAVPIPEMSRSGQEILSSKTGPREQLSIALGTITSPIPNRSRHTEQHFSFHAASGSIPQNTCDHIHEKDPAKSYICKVLSRTTQHSKVSLQQSTISANSGKHPLATINSSACLKNATDISDQSKISLEDLNQHFSVVPGSILIQPRTDSERGQLGHIDPVSSFSEMPSENNVLDSKGCQCRLTPSSSALQFEKNESKKRSQVTILKGDANQPKSPSQEENQVTTTEPFSSGSSLMKTEMPKEQHKECQPFIYSFKKLDWKTRTEKVFPPHMLQETKQESTLNEEGLVRPTQQVQTTTTLGTSSAQVTIERPEQFQNLKEGEACVSKVSSNLLHKSDPCSPLWDASIKTIRQKALNMATATKYATPPTLLHEYTDITEYPPLGTHEEEHRYLHKGPSGRHSASFQYDRRSLKSGYGSQMICVVAHLF